MSEEQIARILERLAAQLETTVSHLWEVMVRQAYIDGVALLSFYVFFAVSLFFIKRNWIRWIEMASSTTDKEAVPGLVYVVCTPVYTIVSIIIIADTFNNFLTAFLNPEFYALQRLFQALTGAG